MKNIIKLGLAICVLLPVTFGISSSLAQDIEPDELGFIIGQPEDLVPGGGGRVVRIYGDASEPGLYVYELLSLLEPVVDRTTIVQLDTSLLLRVPGTLPGGPMRTSMIQTI